MVETIRLMIRIVHPELPALVSKLFGAAEPLPSLDDLLVVCADIYIYIYAHPHNPQAYKYR